MKLFRTFCLLMVFIQYLYSANLALTPKEKEWIKTHPNIYYASSAEDFPYDFINRVGKHSGMSSDYIALIEEKTGLKFHLKSVKKWSNMLERLDEGSIDLIPYIFYDAERAKRFVFTNYYTKVNEYFITRTDEKAINSFDELQGKTIVVIKGHQLESWLKQNYPDLEVITKKTAYDALLSLSRSEADVYINERSTTLFIIENSNFTNLKINQRFQERGLVEVRMAVKEEYKILASIISKVINSVSDAKRFQIQTKWRNSKSTRKELDGAFGYGRAPYMYDEGSKIGMEFTLVKKALEKSGYTIKDIFQMPLKKGQDALKNDMDLEFSVGVVKDESDGFYYSEPLFHYQNSLITRSSDNIQLKSFEDLSDKKIASWEGFYASHKSQLGKDLNPKTSTLYKEFSDHKEQLESFFSKESDAVIIDPIIFEWYKNKMSGKYKLVEESFKIHSLLKDKTPAVIAFRDERVRDDFNLGLLKIKQDGIYHRTLKAYKSIDLSNQLKRVKLLAAIASTYLFENNYDGLFNAFRPFQRSAMIKGIEVVDESSKNVVLSIRNNNGKFVKVLNAEFELDNLLLNDSYYQKNEVPVLVGQVKLHLGFNQFKDLEYAYFPALDEFKHLPMDEYQDIKELYNKYELSNSNLNFTLEEIEWVRENQIIDVAVDPSWLPNEGFNEKGEYIGIVADYLKHISIVTGVNFNPIQTKTWDDSLKLAREKKVSIVSSPSENKTLNLWYTPSQSYLKSPLCIVMNENEGFVSSLNKLKGKRIAISRSAANTQMIINQYPNLNFIKVEGQNDAISGVALNQYDAAIASFNVASYAISVNGLSTLKIVGKLDKSVSMSFFVAKQDRLLLSIINKALESMSQEQEDQIVEKWIQQKYVEKTDYTLVYQIVGLFIFLILVFYFWNRKLSKEILARQEAQKELANQLEYQKTLLEVIPNPIFVKDANGVFSACNKAYEEAFGIKSNNFIGKTVLSLEYLEDEIKKMYHKQDMDLIRSEQSDTQEHEILYADNQMHNVIYQRNTFKLANGEVGGMMGVFTDITQMKQILSKLQESNELITDSINYASLIQHSIIPDQKLVTDFFEDSFTLWNPRDVVGGDVFFFETLENENEALLMVIDCTGHGVPGAFVTMLVKALEQNIISKIFNSKEPISPAKILKSFNKNMKLLLKQDGPDSTSNAGFDAGIVYINKDEKLIRYAGAELPLYYIENEALSIIKANRHSVGYKSSKIDYEFTEHEMHYDSSIKIYLTTDGYVDQTGGEKGFSFGKRRFKTILEETQNLSMDETKEELVQALKAYQQEYETNDDITIVGFRL